MARAHRHLPRSVRKGGEIASWQEWFKQERGIEPETLEAFAVHTQPGPTTNVPWYDPGDVLFAYSNGEKARHNPLVEKPEQKPRFSFTKGVKPGLFNIGDATKDVIFLVEGETDTMRLWQALHAEGQSGNKQLPGVVGLSGINTWRPELAEALSDARQVYVVLDNDQDYMVVGQVDDAWREIRRDIGAKARRLRLPDDVNDLCEFFDVYDMETLRLYAKKAGGPSHSRYRPLDLRQAPPPPNWLVEGLIAKGDLTLTTGPPGIGKSWLILALAVAIVEGWDEFLGRELHLDAPGRVLIVDQENPLDVVLNRMRLLGLTHKGMDNLRYLWNCGIRLDRDPGKFLDEVLDFEPVFIALDSLTRLHTQDENSAGQIAALMNNGIQPIARETGAAVMLVHHDNKSGDPRGSVDIMASVDAALQAKGLGEANPGSFRLSQIKSRRRVGGSALDITILDDENADRIFLRADEPLNPPF